MALYSLHHGHTPAQAADLLEHLRRLRQGFTQHPASSASMPNRSCEGSRSSLSDAGSSPSDSQVTADRNGVEGSASGCISSPDESEASDQSKIRSEHGTAVAANLQSQATEPQEALFQSLDAVLSTSANPGMLRRKVEQASPTATCAGASCFRACLARLPVKSLPGGFTCRAQCKLLLILPKHIGCIYLCAILGATVVSLRPHVLKDCCLCRC